MNGQAQAGHATPARRGGARAGRRWVRWTGAGGVLLVLAAAGGIAAYLRQPVPSPFTLPTAAAAPPSGPLDGMWTVAPGSAAGFRVRVRESAVGVSNDVVGRTSAVTGTIVIAGDTVVSARLTIGLASLRVDGKVQPQLRTSLDTPADPVATFTLMHPVTLDPDFSAGAKTTVRAAGELSVHGIVRPVTVTLSARRDGAQLQAAGTIPVRFSTWSIRGPRGYGILGSLASRGTAEFLVTLHRQ